ncbi:thioredoxin domain-containing protein [Streptomyces sp. NPDC048383]|uniref:thioredoxin family protein n=1 Tax=Streptomyces sp. NPDC048383 TaxID=3155386 RepID=UPI00341C72CA
MPHTEGTDRRSAVIEVTDVDFEAEVLRERERTVLVEFTAAWCGPCRQLAPVLAAIAEEEADRLKVVVIDADSNPGTVTRYGVLSMPTLLVLRDGEPLRRMVGARPKRKLLQELQEVRELRERPATA